MTALVSDAYRTVWRRLEGRIANGIRTHRMAQAERLRVQAPQAGGGNGHAAQRETPSIQTSVLQSISPRCAPGPLPGFTNIDTIKLLSGLTAHCESFAYVINARCREEVPQLQLLHGRQVACHAVEEGRAV